MAKNIYAVSMVKNESDIIESFCRHTLSFCDGMLVCEDESSDDTKEILCRLIDEGLNIILFDNKDTFWNKQGSVVNTLAHVAIDEYKADLIVPLDADEFLYAVGDTGVRQILEEFDEKHVSFVIWQNYLPTDTKRDNGVFLPKYFSTYFDLDAAIFKVIIGAKLLRDYGAKITAGSHYLKFPNDERIFHGNTENRLRLYHYPIRSVSQAITKVLVTWSNYLCVAKYAEKDASGIMRRMYETIKEAGVLTYEQLPELVKTYTIEDVSCPDGVIPLAEGAAVSDISLRYTDYGKAQSNYLGIIIRHYEKIIANLVEAPDLGVLAKEMFLFI